MQHKEESRKPGGGALHQGSAGASFFMGLSSSRQQGAGGAPPMRGGRGAQGAQVGYEYVSSPTESKNKIYPPPMQEHVEKTDRFPRKNDIKYIPARK